MSYYEIPEDALAEMEAFATANDGPIVMVNLMKLRAQAAYPSGSSAAPCSGAEAMARYSSGSAEVRKQSGARFIWSADAKLAPIAPTDEQWDLVALVEYPNARAYLTMRATPAYQAARLHRQAGLSDSRLIMTVGRGPSMP